MRREWILALCLVLVAMVGVAWAVYDRDMASAIYLTESNTASWHSSLISQYGADIGTEYTEYASWSSDYSHLVSHGWVDSSAAEALCNLNAWKSLIDDAYGENVVAGNRNNMAYGCCVEAGAHLSDINWTNWDHVVDGHLYGQYHASYYNTLCRSCLNNVETYMQAWQTPECAACSAIQDNMWRCDCP